MRGCWREHTTEEQRGRRALRRPLTLGTCDSVVRRSQDIASSCSPLARLSAAEANLTFPSLYRTLFVISLRRARIGPVIYIIIES